MKRMILLLMLVLAAPEVAPAQTWCPDWRPRRPYGDYCSDSRWGGYGARKEVRSAEEARKIVQTYFAGDDVKVGKVSEKERYYEVEILDNKGNKVDLVIVNKRSGRMRSIF